MITSALYEHNLHFILNHLEPLEHLLLFKDHVLVDTRLRKATEALLPAELASLSPSLLFFFWCSSVLSVFYCCDKQHDQRLPGRGLISSHTSRSVIAGGQGGDDGGMPLMAHSSGSVRCSTQLYVIPSPEDLTPLPSCACSHMHLPILGTHIYIIKKKNQSSK